MTKDDIENYGGCPNVMWKDSWINFMNGLDTRDQPSFFWLVTNYCQWGYVQECWDNDKESRIYRYFENCCRNIIDNQRKSWFEWYKRNQANNK